MLADIWHVELLGRCRLTCGKEYIDRFRTQKTGAILAYLALYCPRRTVTREELAAVFWAEDEPPQANHSLRQSLSWLRARLEPDGTVPGSVLQTPPRMGAVGLQPGSYTSDVMRFESLLRDSARPNLSPDARGQLLQRALALYRGDLLPGVYDDWAQTERERLIALRDRAEHELACNPLSFTAAANDTPVSPAPGEGRPGAALPCPINRFWGRDGEMAHLTERLRGGTDRLLTVTAPGGFGKTRLALEVAYGVADAFGGGVHWVSLADLPVSVCFVDVLEAALNLPPIAGKGGGLARVATAFNRRGGRTLLVVDNAETPLADHETGVSAQIARLLESAPRVTCLVTSRVPLAVAGECEVALAPLPVGQDPHCSPAVSLLVDRVQAIRRDFTLTPRNRDSVYALCERLGGIPLALELAAARLRTLTPQTLLSEIVATPDLWENLGEEQQRRGRPERHRRLWVTLESSFSALSPPARAAVAALTVFQSGWTADAAAALIGTGAGASLREVAALAWSVPGGADRWSLPVPLKEFAAEHLMPEARETFLTRHAAYFADRAREAFANRHTAAQIDWLSDLSADRENIRLALASLTQRSPGDALRLAANLSWFWRRRGDWDAGRRLLRGLLDDPRSESAPAETRADALIGMGDLCWSLGRMDETEAVFHEARTVASHALVPEDVRMRTGERLGRFLIATGRWRDGEPLLVAARRWYAQAGNRRAAGKCLGGIALAAHYAEDYPLARALLREALREVASAGDLLERTALIHQCGWCGAPEESGEERVARCETLLALSEETGDILTRATALLELGEAYRHCGDLEASQARLREGCAVARSVGAVLEEALIRNQEGVTLRLLNRLTESEDAHREALTLALQISLNAFGPRVRIVLADFAVLLRARKDEVAATRIHGAISAWSERNGLPLAPAARSLYRDEQRELRRSLGADVFDAAWRAGADAGSVAELL